MATMQSNVPAATHYKYRANPNPPVVALLLFEPLSSILAPPPTEAGTYPKMHSIVNIATDSCNSVFRGEMLVVWRPPGVSDAPPNWRTWSAAVSVASVGKSTTDQPDKLFADPSEAILEW